MIKEKMNNNNNSMDEFVFDSMITRYCDPLTNDVVKDEIETFMKTFNISKYELIKNGFKLDLPLTLTIPNRELTEREKMFLSSITKRYF